MKAYRLTVNLKLGLILFAVMIAVASLWYTNHLVNRLRERERASVQLWAGANEQIVTAPSNIYGFELSELDRLIATLQSGRTLSMPDTNRLESFRQAIAWAQTMPPPEQFTFISDILLFYIDVPAIITDSLLRPVNWRNVSVSDTTTSPQDTLRLMRRLEEMAEAYPPIPIALDYGERELRQYVYYDESRMIKELRIYPFLQLLFVGLFILVGYLGFSYVRRSEQSSLWVGMAREAAHQLGTPISSLMGWLELLRDPMMPDVERQTSLDEVEKDVERLRRVANRFGDIGSLPKLENLALAPFIGNTADYMRRRIPRHGKRVRLDVLVPDELRAPLNPELFEWVIENLLKNALDAIDGDEGSITVSARAEQGRILIDVADTGKGIDRRQWGNVFRPGYSTKTRGWGLGLSLAKRIVEDYHGGTLTLAGSKVGQGSTFRVELPQG